MTSETHEEVKRFRRTMDAAYLAVYSSLPEGEDKDTWKNKWFETMDLGVHMILRKTGHGREHHGSETGVVRPSV